MVIMNDLEWPMLSYYEIYYEKFRNVMQQPEKDVMLQYYWSLDSMTWQFSFYEFVGWLGCLFTPISYIIVRDRCVPWLALRVDMLHTFMKHGIVNPPSPIWPTRLA